MTPLPPPPPPVAPQWRPTLRPGDLTPAWRVVFCLGWIGVVLVFAAVWKSGRTLGLAPWWLGPSAAPHNIAVNLIPFVLPVATAACAMRSVRHLPWIGLVAALGVAGVAAGDAGRFPGIAAVELAAAVAGLLVSLACFAGLLRSPAEVTSATDDAAGGTAADDAADDGTPELVTFRSSPTQ